MHAHEEAAEFLVAALDALEGDRDAGPGQRYHLLFQLIEAYRWSARLPELVGAVEQAIEAAEQLGDLDLAARAALSATQGGLWQSAPDGQVNERVVGALRAQLDTLPPGDGELRCRVLLALANEESTVVPMDQGRVLVDEALAMATRLADPHLELLARQVATSVIWIPRPATRGSSGAPRRWRWPGTSGSEQAFVVSSTLRTVVLSELGRVEEMAAAAAVSRAEAERLRIAYGELVLGAVTMPWLALRGRFVEGQALLERMRVCAGRVNESFAGEAMVAAQATLWMWQGEELRAANALHALAAEPPYPLAAPVTALMLRADEADQAREHLELVGGLRLAPEDHELAGYLDCHAAEVALRLGDAEVAADCYRRLTPYAGRTGQAGSALNAGPIDAFLAMAAAATGETVRAAEHADAAVVLMDRWDSASVARGSSGSGSGSASSARRPAPRARRRHAGSRTWPG